MNWLRFLRQEEDEPCVAVTLQLLRQLQVKVTGRTVRETLLHHPDHPSLLCISDGLHQWGVDNVCIRTEMNDLPNLPAPFIVHTKEGEGRFLLVMDVEGEKISYLDEYGRREWVAFSSFSLHWDGIVLLAEAKAGAGEKDYQSRSRIIRWQALRVPLIAAVCTLLALMLCLYGSERTNGYTAAIFLAKLAGCCVALLLLHLEAGGQSSLAGKVCGFSEKRSCSAVLQSRGARIAGIVSWSELGFYYFSGGLLLLLFSAPSLSSAIDLLALLNLAALPFILYSVTYQWRVVRKWCMLCLTVLFILALEAGLYLLSGRSYATDLSEPILPAAAAISFLLPLLLWMAVKPVYRRSLEQVQYRRELGRLKSNPDLFRFLLSEERSMNSEQDEAGLLLGEPGASRTLTVVCNPYCAPCARAHPFIESIMDRNSDVKVQLIFSVSMDEADSRLPPVRHFTGLYERDRLKARQAISDWFEGLSANYDAFVARYPLNGPVRQPTEKIRAMEAWCKREEVAFTPTFYLDGRRLPPLYTAEDLAYFSGIGF
ncbi:MAG TPA: vitamin K epoxide reductase family protein [Flavisolibacter sp.]|nr:vitamin K epoxide reductase family protein [Flavisolibacter sp.]